MKIKFKLTMTVDYGKACIHDYPIDPQTPKPELAMAEWDAENEGVLSIIEFFQPTFLIEDIKECK